MPAKKQWTANGGPWARGIMPRPVQAAARRVATGWPNARKIASGWPNAAPPAGRGEDRMPPTGEQARVPPQEELWEEECPSGSATNYDGKAFPNRRFRNRGLVRQVAAILRTRGGRPEHGPPCWVSATGEAALDELATLIQVAPEHLRETLEFSAPAQRGEEGSLFRIRDEEHGKCFVSLAPLEVAPLPEVLWVEEDPSDTPWQKDSEKPNAKIRNRDLVRRAAAVLRTPGRRPDHYHYQDGPACAVSTGGEADLDDLAAHIQVSAKHLRETLEFSVAAQCGGGKTKFQFREEKGKCFVGLAALEDECGKGGSARPTVPKPTMAPGYQAQHPTWKCSPIAPPRAPPWTLHEAPRLPSPVPPKRRRRLGGDVSQGAVHPIFGDPHPVHSLAGLPTTIFSCPNEWRLWRLEEQAHYQCYITGREALDSIPDEQDATGE